MQILLIWCLYLFLNDIALPHRWRVTTVAPVLRILAGVSLTQVLITIWFELGLNVYVNYQLSAFDLW